MREIGVRHGLQRTEGKHFFRDRMVIDKGQRAIDVAATFFEIADPKRRGAGDWASAETRRNVFRMGSAPQGKAPSQVIWRLRHEVAPAPKKRWHFITWAYPSAE